MDITRFAIEKKVVTITALVLIFLAGLSAYTSLPRAEDPGFIVRTALVTTIFPGAGPDRVELLVTDKLEKALQEIPEVDNVKSESRTGMSVVTVNFLESETDMRPLFDALRRKVDKATGDLPDGIIGPLVNDEFGDVFGTVITLTGEGFTYAELKEVADEVRNELLAIPDAAKVEIYGAQDERVFVEYSNARLAELGLSTVQLMNILESRNIIIPGGSVSTGAEQLQLEPSGNFVSVEDLGRTVVTLPAGETVFLEDIVTIERGYVDPATKRVTASGVPALALAVSMRDGGNIIDLGDAIQGVIDRLQQLYPIGIEFDFVAFQAATVEAAVNGFVVSLLQAIFLVIAVMLLFLGFRTGLVVAALIPTAIIMALLLMSTFGIGLDQVSLAALIIALGMLVDNAIVMSESIMVQMSEGKAAIRSAVDSAKELRIPLLTSSLTTAAAFLPIYLAESATGEYTAPLFLVVTITLLSSWILALTMTPLLCVMFLKIKPKKQDKEAGFNTPFYRKYRGLLLTLLRRPVLTVAGAIGLLVIALGAFRFVPNVFFPPKTEVMFTAEFDLPSGIPLTRTEAFVTDLEAYMREALTPGQDREEGIANWATFMGSGAPKFNLPYSPEPPRTNYAFMLVNTTSYEAQAGVIAQMNAFVEANYPDVVPRIQQLQNGAPVNYPVEVRISGKDPDVIFQLADQVKARLAELPGTATITDDWGSRIKKLDVLVSDARARRAGVSSQDIAVSLQTALSGFETTQYREGDQIIPVVLRSVAADRQDIGKMESINVYAQLTGRNVPLRQVADIELAYQPSKIKRYNRARTVTVQSTLAENATATDVVSKLMPWLEAEAATWPIGYGYALGGEIETSVKSQQSIGEKLPIAGLIILLLLVGQFNSIRKPAIILLTIPLGLIGVVIGLLVTGNAFGFMTLLGVISLAGIVINNAIVLIDRIQIEMDENGFAPAEAVVEATQRRLRPILLTTLTTSLGLLPLWFSGGPLFESMAVAILFGLLFATVLTLGFVPTLYALFFRVSFKGYRHAGDAAPVVAAPVAAQPHIDQGGTK